MGYITPDMSQNELNNNIITYFCTSLNIMCGDGKNVGVFLLVLKFR